ncbi:MAG: type II secretion system protein [Firmicutes bacterium]|nr:type II secretion system protein [Bacillota bacterium]
MKNRSKKGFTIVELVIVIAVIAILAAVLIPTFSSLIKKANESADLQNTRNMNTVIAANEEKIEEYYQEIKERENLAFDPKTAEAEAVYRVCLDIGYSIAKINYASNEYAMVYDYGNHSFVLMQLVDEEIRIVFPDNAEVEDSSNYILVCSDEEKQLEYFFSSWQSFVGEIFVISE